MFERPVSLLSENSVSSILIIFSEGLRGTFVEVDPLLVQVRSGKTEELILPGKLLMPWGLLGRRTVECIELTRFLPREFCGVPIYDDEFDSETEASKFTYK